MTGEHVGLTLTHVDGEYLRGTRRTNPKEADVVVQAVLDHARERPSETLGVVALSVAQRDEIRNKVEYERTRHPELEAFCNESKADPFFVKNLESVQGDERDAIFISIGYGRDAGGYMSQSFGPISSDGGERRLNVLFTRAKKRCRVFSSIRHTDIRLDAARHLGPRVLARFLKYAETGELDIPKPTGMGADSPFEESVQRVLHLNGYQAVPQVGSAGFRIDLAVCDPEDEARYILAVECDGARYHSSSWARERDRLRQSVLESKGWTFHRIWSTDWFQNQAGETKKLIATVERARAHRGAPDPKEPAPPLKVGRAKHVPEEEHSAVPYAQAVFFVQNSRQVPIPAAALKSLARFVHKIVEVEGPVHGDVVKRRLNEIWGNTRMAPRISARLDEAIGEAVRARLVQPDSSGVFLDQYSRASPVVVRDRSGIASSYERGADKLPPAELRAAAKEVVRRSRSATPEECAKEVARVLGYKSLTKRLRERIEPEIRELERRKELERQGAYLRLAARD